MYVSCLIVEKWLLIRLYFEVESKKFFKTFEPAVRKFSKTWMSWSPLIDTYPIYLVVFSKKKKVIKTKQNVDKCFLDLCDMKVNESNEWIQNSNKEKC